ncbi:MAG: arylsulfotransferase family protein [Bdellovibrionota bacterium]
MKATTFAICVSGIFASAVITSEANSAPVTNVPIVIQNVPEKYLRWSEDFSKLEILEFNRQLPPILKISDTDIKNCKIGGKPCNDFMLKPKPHGHRLYRLSYSQNGIKKKIEIDVLGKKFPDFWVRGKSKTDRPLVFSTFDQRDLTQCFLYALSKSGEIDFAQTRNGVCMDFRPHLVNGKMLYSLSEIHHHLVAGAQVGNRVILDAEFNEVRTIEGAFDMHEFLLLGDNHYIAIEVDLQKLNSTMDYSNRFVREMKDGKVVFEWGVKEYVAEKGASAQGAYIAPESSLRPQAVADLIHLNSVEVHDTGYLIGLGGNGVTFVDRKTRKTQWILGGFQDEFGLSRRQFTHLAHMQSYNPKTNTLMVYGHGVGEWPQFKQVLTIKEYELDLKNRTLKNYKSMQITPEYPWIMGSVQKIEDIYSVSFGVHTGPRAFAELENGTETFAFGFNRQDISAYRVYRQPHGEPPVEAKVEAKTSSVSK